MRPDSQTSAMFVSASASRGLRYATFAAPVRVPVLRVADHEVEDPFPGGEPI